MCKGFYLFKHRRNESKECFLGITVPSTSWSGDLIPGQETKIPHAPYAAGKKKEKKLIDYFSEQFFFSEQF